MGKSCGDGGMPLPVVAKNLGHADTRMVEKHYGHLAPSYVAEAVRNTPQIWQGEGVVMVIVTRLRHAIGGLRSGSWLYDSSSRAALQPGSRINPYLRRTLRSEMRAFNK